jgi:hypothetical protein
MIDEPAPLRAEPHLPRSGSVFERLSQVAMTPSPWRSQCAHSTNRMGRP